MSKGIAVITIASDGDKVNVCTTFDPPSGHSTLNPVSHQLASVALLAIARECKGTQDHEIRLA